MGSTIEIGKKPRSVRERVSKAEWQARCELAAAHRLVAHFVFVDMTYNHVSVRVPGEPDHFLVKADNLFMEQVTASSLVKYDLEPLLRARLPRAGGRARRRGAAHHPRARGVRGTRKEVRPRGRLRLEEPRLGREHGSGGKAVSRLQGLNSREFDSAPDFPYCRVAVPPRRGDDAF